MPIDPNTGKRLPYPGEPGGGPPRGSPTRGRPASRRIGGLGRGADPLPVSGGPSQVDDLQEPQPLTVAPGFPVPPMPEPREGSPSPSPEGPVSPYPPGGGYQPRPPDQGPSPVDPFLQEYGNALDFPGPPGPPRPPEDAVLARPEQRPAEPPVPPGLLPDDDWGQFLAQSLPEAREMTAAREDSPEGLPPAFAGAGPGRGQRLFMGLGAYGAGGAVPGVGRGGAVSPASVLPEDRRKRKKPEGF
jgi:hypothetical protein